MHASGTDRRMRSQVRPTCNMHTVPHVACNACMHDRIAVPAPGTAHSLMQSSLTSVNALTQSVFECRRPKKDGRKPLVPATAAPLSMSKKSRQKTKTSPRSEKSVFLPIFASEKRCGRVFDTEFLSEIERKHSQWTPHGMVS